MKTTAREFLFWMLGRLESDSGIDPDQFITDTRQFRAHVEDSREPDGVFCSALDFSLELIEALIGLHDRRAMLRTLRAKLRSHLFPAELSAVDSQNKSPDF